MNREKKTEYQEIMIAKLRSKVADLESENNVLSRRNQLLLQELSSIKETFDLREAKIANLEYEYSNAIFEATEAKNSYEVARAEIIKMKFDYERRMNALLNRLKN